MSIVDKGLKDIAQMQLFYLSKGAMAEALAAQRHITLPDARSRVSLAKVEAKLTAISIQHPKTGRMMRIGEGKVFATPDKWLEWDGTVQLGRPRKQKMI